MEINHNHWRLRQELSQMERYLDLVATAVDNNEKHFAISVQEISEDEMAGYPSSLDDFIEELNDEVRDDFPRRLYASFVVSWYSFMESRLLDFCSLHKLQVSVSVQDQKNLGKGIRRARNFLLRGGNYEIDNIHWTELVQIGKVRNLLIHSSGKLPHTWDKPSVKKLISGKQLGGDIYLNTEENLTQYLDEHKIWKYRGRFFITPNLEYCKHLIQFGTDFFENLYATFGKEK